MSTSISDQPHAKSVEFLADAMVVHFQDGRKLSVPIQWFPRLKDAIHGAGQSLGKTAGRTPYLHPGKMSYILTAW
jgi:hypothetical protein